MQPCFEPCHKCLTFAFASPQWSDCLWAIAILAALLVWLEWRRGSALSELLSAVMQLRLVRRLSMTRRILTIVLLALSACCFVVALMRPQYGLTYVKSTRVGAQIMFCLDLSKSMLAEDTAPNRLERAKADITDLLGFLQGDQVGLIGFAGRARVMCPLTPDYGFFKLILDGADPDSIGMGGTRLEEPLRKALEGFRAESDVSRVVFLITDGEDHDSKPLDVANDAIERGIKIVAVGLGDESGSEILITDPNTGATERVLDGDGNPVVTRLDGDTLRELAMATEGVYIPAGTGTLDLNSIYQAHIKPLVRGQMESEGRAVRNDAFQWAILAGLVLLMAALAMGSGLGFFSQTGAPATGQTGAPATGQTGAPAAGQTLMTVCLLALTVNSMPNANALAADAEQNADDAQSIDVDPRSVYNQALQKLDNDLDDAEELLSSARSIAKGDGELRFRATYNLGWVSIKRADQSIQTEPQQALEHLERAAGWFRDAVRLRSDAAEARHNLEVVLLRITQLRDQLNRSAEKNLTQQLDEAIETQREIIVNLREMVQRIAASNDPNVADQFREIFRRLATQQRIALSDLQGIGDQAAAETETIESKADEERTPEDSLRMAQLSGVLHYLGQANQRIGQSRSQLRRRQASRAFRRAATGLSQLKRARDQLRNPLELIDGILADQSSLAGETMVKSLPFQVSNSNNQAADVPAWIDQDYLVDSQSDITMRTGELTQRIKAGLDSETKQQQDSQTASQRTADPNAAAQEKLIKQLREATPFLSAASESMLQVDVELAKPDYNEASKRQIESIESLRQAKERFADLRTLIELALSAQTNISRMLDAAAGDVQPEEQKDDSGTSNQSGINQSDSNESDSNESDSKASEGDESGTDDVDGLPSDTVALMLGEAGRGQIRNIERMNRLADEIEFERKQLELRAQSNDPQTPDAETGKPSQEAELQRFELAAKLADQARAEMSVVSQNLAGEDDSNSVANAQQATASAKEKLIELRRLFFSVIEHLRETARRQAALNDDTEQQAGIQAEASNEPINAPAVEKLAATQKELQQVSTQISQALLEQAQQQAQAAAGGNPAGENATSHSQGPDADTVEQASGLVAQAADRMNHAADQLSAPSPELAEARTPQNESLEFLIEALRLLQPPDQNQSEPNQSQQNQPQPNSGQDESDQEESNQEDQQGASEDQQREEQNQSQPQMDPSRLLQAVRDREASRQRDRKHRNRATSLPVEKDW